MNPMVIEAAEFDAATGTIVLRLHGQQPLYLTASPAVLRDLKAAVQDCCAPQAKQKAGRPARPRRTKAE